MFTSREQLQGQVAALAQRGVWLGTSSWKYPGWLGQIYTEDRYVWRGRFANSRFEKLCLREYAEVFKTVSVDAAYYRFPDHAFLESMASLVPADFQFALKVTDEITIRRFPNLPRFGARAGQTNPDFLNTDRFATAFLQPCESFRANLGLILFEFSRFHASDFARGREFVEALDGFLAKLPGGWRYGVEIRNAAFLQPEYFGALARHGVAHVFNSWEAMPPLDEQVARAGSLTQPRFGVARLLLKPGRRYEEAVKQLSPYARLQEVNEAGRAGAVNLMRNVLERKNPERVFIYVNNRFEGHAPSTVAALAAAVLGE